MPEKTPRRIRQESEILPLAGILLPYEIVVQTGYPKGAVTKILAENGYPTINRKKKKPELLTDEQKTLIKDLYLGTPERGPIGLKVTADRMGLTRKTVRDYLESEQLLKPKGRTTKE